MTEEAGQKSLIEARPVFAALREGVFAWYFLWARGLVSVLEAEKFGEL